MDATTKRTVKLLDLTAQYLPIRNEIRRAIDEVCDAQALILGPHVEKFEKHLAEYCGTKHAIGVSSGTDALLCAMMALDVGPGDEVICPSFTFFATAGCIARLGATPVFAEIDPRTFNLDPADLPKRITSKTKAILPVHLFGQVANMEAINEIACKNNLPVIEDAAQAIGARRNGRKACAHGLIGCLSFYPTKNLGAFGDAGGICTNDDKLAEKCRKLRVHGSGHTYYHDYIGGMFRLAAIQAAVLDVKLKYLEGWHEARRRNAVIYNEILAGSNVVTPFIEEGNWSIYNQYVVRVKNRDEVKKKLGEAGVGNGIYYPLGLHMQKCFSQFGGKEGDLPATELACKEVLALPIYPELHEDEVRYAAEMLREAAK
ncbi:DegT/DnrJ/EryC1/StrS family aminotransferase [Humisphaera borealis]|uniref:DegT/DnrJ/EryC1/StrS family aminotransferase n=2 Tax=Humisphaera borealis TaxID=2807512 RepID=A0A7M2X6D7_9BACT|nr:DegT/DnrJ/EryC1/StrS family aminotransferase [Humisphaera borealis]